MTKGKETYSSELTFVNDPNSLLTEEERIANHEATIKLYNMSQELAYMVYQIDEILVKAEEVKAQGGSKRADGVINDLMNLKKKLVTTTGDNYVDTEEAKLRGNIADLYSKIASGFQAPTASEMENMNLLEERFNSARQELNAIKAKQVPKMEQYMEGKGMTEITFKSYEEFIEE